jgi:hypothetical protein
VKNSTLGKKWIKLLNLFSAKSHQKAWCNLTCNILCCSTWNKNLQGLLMLRKIKKLKKICKTDC